MATPKQPVITQQGRRATRTVGMLRLAGALATIGVITNIGTMFDDSAIGTMFDDSAIGTIFDDSAIGTTELALAAFTIAAAVFAFAEIAYGGRAARAEERRIRSRILQCQYAMASQPIVDRDAYPPGRVIQMMTDGVERVTEFRQAYLGSTIAAMAIPIVTLVYIGVFIDPVIGFVVLGLTPVIPLAIGGFMRAFRKTSAHSRQQRATLTVRYLDAIRNLVTIRLLGAGDRLTAQLRIDGERNRRGIMRLLAGNQIVIIVMDGVFSLVLICVTASLMAARASHLTPGQALSIALLTVLLLEPLQQVAGFFYIGMGGIASQKEIRGYLEHAATAPALGAVGAGPAIDIDTRPHSADPHRDHPGRTDLAIECNRVSFDYGRGPVLDGLDLAVPSGARIAITGASGAGKSTLLGLLRGSLPIQHGHIAVDGHDLALRDPASTRSLTATVSQTTWMFTGTVADNLRISREDATDAELWHALRLAHVADDIEAMPRGLDTDLGEAGSLISGGQAQRISLARALVSGRRILILDEPTSQVDIESESRITDALGALGREWTLVMVTHRPSLLRIADDVHELHDGRLVERETIHV